MIVYFPPQASEEALEAQASQTSWRIALAWSGDLRNRYHFVPTSGMEITHIQYHEETSSAAAGKIKDIKANDDSTTCFTKHDSRSSEKNNAQ